jgi:hypothetical protein
VAISLDTSQSSYGACQTPPQAGGTQASPSADAIAPTDDQLTATANQVVGKPGGGGHHHHHHGGAGAAQGVQMPDSSILSALTGTSSTDSTSSTGSTLTQLLQNMTSSDSTSSDSTDSSLQQLLEQLNGSSSSGYGSDGTTPAASGSLGLSALV